MTAVVDPVAMLVYTLASRLLVGPVGPSPWGGGALCFPPP
jgi:hypothetical protein